MKNKGFGSLKTRLFAINTFKHVGLGGGPMVFTVYNICLAYIIPI